jgi:hypothetical protein
MITLRYANALLAHLGSIKLTSLNNTLNWKSVGDTPEAAFTKHSHRMTSCYFPQSTNKQPSTAASSSGSNEAYHRSAASHKIHSARVVYLRPGDRQDNNDLRRPMKPTRATMLAGGEISSRKRKYTHRIHLLRRPLQEPLTPGTLFA